MLAKTQIPFLLPGLPRYMKSLMIYVSGGDNNSQFFKSERVGNTEAKPENYHHEAARAASDDSDPKSSGEVLLDVFSL